MARCPLLRHFLAAAGLAGAVPVAAELAELPLRLPLDAHSVALELQNADVELRVDPDAEAVLTAMLVAGEPGPAELDVSSDGPELTVARPADADGRKPRLRLEMTVTPAQSVSLEGRDLAVTIGEARSAEELASADEEPDESRLEPPGEELAGGGETPPPAGDAPAGGPPAAAAPAVAARLRLTVDSSRVDFTGTRNAVLEATRTSVWMTRTSGAFTISLAGGSADIRGHQGDLELEATAAEVAVHDLRGRLEPRLVGGSLDVRQGTGVFEGTAADAVVLFDGWLGYVTLRGAGTTVEARGVDRPMPWNLEGADLLVTLEKIAGPVTANLQGGRFSAAVMAGRVAVTATRRTDVELEGLDRGADVKLSEGATARLAGVAGQVKVELADAELRAERSGNLLLSGARSRVDVAGIDRLAQLEMSDSNLVLDLTSSDSSSSLKLLGTGRTAVRLPAPCIVRLAGPPGSESSAVDVSGCDLHLPGQPGRPAGGRLFYGERRPVTLTVWREEGVELEVVGSS